MNVKEAVSRAKDYVSDIFANEEIEELGLEEVEFDSEANCWSVTVGFARPWEKKRETNSLSFLASNALRRTYKVVLINANDGSVTSVKDKRLQTAA